MAFPIPLAPPVTTATLVLSSVPFTEDPVLQILSSAYKRCPQGLDGLRKKSVLHEILALCVGVLCRPFGTRLIDLILPGTDVPGYRLFRPYGTGVVAVPSPFEPHNRLGKDAVASRQEPSGGFEARTQET
jgi:hypothetical protein